MNFYPFHLGDYVKKTAHLTPMEDLIYRRLIDRYYMTEQPIPLDVEGVARLIGMRDHISFVSDILSEFFLKSEDGYRHERCDEEIEKYHKKADSARKANQLRWNFTEETSETDLKSDADQILTKNQEPRTRTNKILGEMSPDFLTFWQAYPRKVGKGNAWKAWCTAAHCRPSMDVILAAIRKARQSQDWQKEKGAFIPHPSTWLNQERWHDEGMDYAALAGKRDSGAARGQEIDESAAFRWRSERHPDSLEVNPTAETYPFRVWPDSTKSEYRNYLKHEQKN